MRIAYLCSDFGVPIHGSKGASIHVREFSRALAALGNDVAIFTCRAGGDAPSGFDLPVHEIGLEPTETLIYDLLREDARGGVEIAREVRSTLYATGLRHRAEPLLRRFQPDLIYERYALFGTAGMDLARDLGVPLILEVNAPLSEEQAAHRGLAFAQTARAVERAVLRAADRVIAVSEPLRAWIVGGGVDPSRVLTLPNGVDVDRFAAGAGRRDEIRAALGLNATQPVVGFVGTLKAWHGTETLLRAVATLHRRGSGERSGPHLLIVGDGTERVALESLARSEGIAAVTTFTGAVRHDQMPGYLAAIDVAVAPYNQEPNFYFSPLKLFEYMAAGRPIVAAAIGQIAVCMRHGETGLLYPPGRVDTLASAIADLLTNPALAAALGRAAQADSRRHHTWLSSAATVADLARVALGWRSPAVQATTSVGSAPRASADLLDVRINFPFVRQASLGEAR